MVSEPAEAPGASVCVTPETYSASSEGAAAACYTFEAKSALQDGAGRAAADPNVTQPESTDTLTALSPPSEPSATPAASAVVHIQPAPVRPSADASLAGMQACPFIPTAAGLRKPLDMPQQPQAASFQPQPQAQAAAAAKSDILPLHQQQHVERFGEVPRSQTASCLPQPQAQAAAAAAKSDVRPLHKQQDVERFGEAPRSQTASCLPQPQAQAAAAAKSDVKPLRKQQDVERSGEMHILSSGAPAAHHQQAATLHSQAPVAVSPAKQSSTSIIATGKAATAPHDAVPSAATSAKRSGPQKQASRPHTPSAPASAAPRSPQYAAKDVLSDIQDVCAIKHAAPRPTAIQQVSNHQQAAQRSAGTTAGPSAEDNLCHGRQPPGTHDDSPD